MDESKLGKENSLPLVLIVDDEPTNINLLAQTLHSFCRLKIARSAEQAFAILDTGEEPDLILLDIIMPGGMDGMEACRLLKGDPKRKHIPVIFTTAKNTTENEIDGLCAGAIDYISKPFSPSLVEHRVKIHLQRIQSAAEMRLAHAVFDNIQEGIVVTDSNSIIQRLNPGAEKISGYVPEELIGKPIDIWNSGKHDKAFFANIVKTLKRDGYWKGEIWNRRKDGTVYPTYQTISRLEGDAGKGDYFVSLFSDISKQKAMEEALTYQAHHDTLTGLPNRQLFLDRLDQTLQRSKRGQTSFALLFIDLDRFKHINDSMGHPAGDELLKMVSERLCDGLRASDTVARLGGDEFTVILNELDNVKDAAFMAKKFIAKLATPFELREGLAQIGCSIGIAMYPEDGDTLNELMNHADMAMFHAKEEGRNTYRFFTKELHTQAQGKISIERELRKSIEKAEIRLVFQPIIDLSSNKVSHMEAFCRWHHPQMGLMPPDVFIPIAEESPLMFKLNTWVLKAAISQCKQWDEEGLPPLPVSINIGAFKNSHGLDHLEVRTILEENNFPGSRLTFELAESSLVSQNEEVIAWMQGMKELGIKIIVDDFGTSHSSLVDLKNYPIDGLKIDHEFIRQMDENKDDFLLVKTICALSNSLGISAYAEGVETKEQRDLLNTLNPPCQFIQGHYVAKPMEAIQVGGFIKA